MLTLQLFLVNQVFNHEERKYRRPSVSLCTLLLSALDTWQSGKVDRARLLLGLFLLGQGLDDLLLLGLETLLSALAGLLCLGAASLGLIAEGQTEKERCSYSM